MFLPTSLIARLDPWCIAPYRWLPDAPEAAFFLGTFLLAAQAALLGLLTIRLGVRMHARRLKQLRDDMTRYHQLGERALQEQGKETFKAVNRQAHEAFGYYFSLNGALWLASLWPVPPLLAWMQLRFLEASPALPFPCRCSARNRAMYSGLFSAIFRPGCCWAAACRCCVATQGPRQRRRCCRRVRKQEIS